MNVAILISGKKSFIILDIMQHEGRGVLRYARRNKASDGRPATLMCRDDLK